MNELLSFVRLSDERNVVPSSGFQMKEMSFIRLSDEKCPFSGFQVKDISLSVFQIKEMLSLIRLLDERNCVPHQAFKTKEMFCPCQAPPACCVLQACVGCRTCGHLHRGRWWCRVTSLAPKDATLSTVEPDGDHLVQAAEHVNTCVGETVAQAMLRPAPELS